MLRQNNLFRNNQSQLYRELGGTKGSRLGGDTAPVAAESRRFWSEIWSVKKEYNREASWIDSV